MIQKTLHILLQLPCYTQTQERRASLCRHPARSREHGTPIGGIAMKTMTRYQIALASGAMLALLFSLSAQADDPAANAIDNAPMVLHLGKLDITGQQKIIDTLLAIKVALHEPVSDDPAVAAKVVCRINKETGTALEYLDCATNRDLSLRHEYSQEQMLARRNGLPTSGYGEA